MIVLKCIVTAVLYFNCCSQNYQQYEKMRLLLCSSRAELKWVALFIISLQLCSDALEVKLSEAESWKIEKSNRLASCAHNEQKQ